MPIPKPGSSDRNPNYAVGRNRPPKHTQFAKGVSPNPGGRPKKQPSVYDHVTKLLNRKIAIEIEAIVTKALRDRLTSTGRWLPTLPETDAVATFVAKIEIQTGQLAMSLTAHEPLADHNREGLQDQDDAAFNDQNRIILIPWIKPPARKFRDVINPTFALSHRTRPIRAERRAGLIRAVARGRQWLDEIVSGRMTIEDIAARQMCSPRQINLTLSMAFLAPPLVKAALEGRLPRGIGIAELRDAPAEWSKQYAKLGLPPQ